VSNITTTTIPNFFSGQAMIYTNIKLIISIDFIKLERHLNLIHVRMLDKIQNLLLKLPFYPDNFFLNEEKQ
jgi:hypothetical protein